MAPQFNEVPVSWIDDESIKALPVFLVKLLRMLEDNEIDDMICWDRSGTSFHILDTSKFCDSVLPHYFKHRNLNSFVRQLNFYGFRKLAAADKATLTHIESASDDLHFMHPKFVRGRPNMMYQIKRQTNPTKKLTAVAEPPTPVIPTARATSNNHKDWAETVNEVKELRARNDDLQVIVENMERTQSVLIDEIQILRKMVTKQNDCFNKLMTSLVNMMNPSKKVQRRPRPYVDHSGESFMVATRNGCDVLACIQKEFQENFHISKESVFDESNKSSYFEYYEPESNGPVIDHQDHQNVEYITTAEAQQKQLALARPKQTYAYVTVPKMELPPPALTQGHDQRPSTSYNIPQEPVYYYTEEPPEFLEQESPSGHHHVETIDKVEPIQPSEIDQSTDNMIENELMEFLETDLHGYLPGEEHEWATAGLS